MMEAQQIVLRDAQSDRTAPASVVKKPKPNPPHGSCPTYFCHDAKRSQEAKVPGKKLF